ncbi:MAG: hypothetical protein GY945_01875 [Rhodobacteraceae bacterium]|nr:hypothetical protein [Paracoccaceae bacterium]
MKRLVVLLAMLPGNAFAQDWWQGVWAFDPEWCAVADRAGVSDPGPIEITGDAIIGYENTCTIKSSRQVGTMAAVHLEMGCEAEGSRYDDERILLRESEDVLVIWYGGAISSVTYHRCASVDGTSQTNGVKK